MWWNWKLFVLLLAFNEISPACAEYGRVVRENRYELLPLWCSGRAGLVFLILNVPLYWSNFVIVLAALFFVPWFTVLIVAGASLLAGAPFSMMLRRWNPFLRLLICYAAGAVVVWIVVGIL